MNALNKNNLVRRFFILPVVVEVALQIVKIDIKLPAHMKICKGIHVSVRDCLCNPKDTPQIGELSLSFNSAQVHPIHCMVDFKKKALNNKNSFIEIEEELIPNYSITGYYRDFGKILFITPYPSPYYMKIYFDCLAEI